MYQEGDIRPVPDPTVLTTEALDKAIIAVKEVVSLRFESIDRQMTDRDHAVKLLAEESRRYPSSIETAVTQLRLLSEERFLALKGISEERLDSIYKRFESIQRQFVDNKEAIKSNLESVSREKQAALDSALLAVQEQNRTNSIAADKTERNFGKLIEAVSEKIDDLRERVQMSEGKEKGGSEVIAFILASVSILIALSSVIFVVIFHH